VNLRAKALWAFLVVAPGRVCAEPAPGDSALPFPVLASYHERARQEAREALQRQLATLPGVVRAQVALERTHPAYVPLDRPLPAPKWRVVLVTRGSGPPASALESVLQSAQAHVSGELELVRMREPEPSPPVVASSDPSREVLKHLLAISLVANVLLATLLLARRKLRIS
jgi:hypothetical protein